MAPRTKSPASQARGAAGEPFPAPDAEARFRIWRGMFPAGIQPPQDEELRGLAAQVKLPGGSIRNIVVDAAFRALAGSSRDGKIELRHLVLATAREYQKLGRLPSQGEFGQWYPVVLAQLSGTRSGP